MPDLDAAFWAAKQRAEQYREKLPEEPHLKSMMLVEYEASRPRIIGFKGSDEVPEAVATIRHLYWETGFPDQISVTVDAKLTEKDLDGIIPPTDAMIVMAISKDDVRCGSRQYRLQDGGVHWYEEWSAEEDVGGNVFDLLKTVWDEHEEI
jgi:hypothetical protein